VEKASVFIQASESDEKMAVCVNLVTSYNLPKLYIQFCYILNFCWNLRQQGSHNVRK